ncbi:GMC family oxidoreductase [Leisingera sp. F5]|uniref:GMC family oxidoreductase n=1 Tax=Leisingera sp. F5 TaxID=1813816 RepID=UPI000A5F2BF1|nr:GMC family oxidoreductase [Leisingera sp. F5]
MTQVSLTEAQAADYDTCVIGAGAAGLALALALGRSGLRVLVVEQGGFGTGEIDRSSKRDEIVSRQTHAPRQQTNREAVGGTLMGWGGRCMPFDPEDFGDQSGRHAHPWPIPFEDYARWIAPAAEFLDTDPDFQAPAPPGWPPVQGVSIERVERLNSLEQANALQERLKQSGTPVDLLKHAQLLSMRWDGDPEYRVRELEVLHKGQTAALPCRQAVLACGGLETTRLLLLEQAAHPAIFRKSAGVLGRYYMGHLTGSVAEILFRDPAPCSSFGYQKKDGRSPFRRRFVLTSDAPSNAAFWIENISPSDPRHGSGEISAKHLLLHSDRFENPGPHIANILRDPCGVFDALRSGAGRLLARKARRPQRLVAHGPGPYALAYHAEHFPEHESRVMLCNSMDQTGRRKLKIDFRYGRRTVEGLINSHKLLAHRLRAANVAELFLPEDDAFAEAIIRKSRDGYHQIGLTRMSVNPDDGVVDANCRVHGAENLFVASASVFPVSGQANPTLSVVAMALRLAAHILENHRTGSAG